MIGLFVVLKLDAIKIKRIEISKSTKYGFNPLNLSEKNI